MSETMQTLMRKSACVMLSLLLLLSVVLPVKAAAETAPAKVVRVGSFYALIQKAASTGAKKSDTRCFYESTYEILLKIPHGGGKIIL